MKIALLTEYFPISSKREMRGGVEARTYYVARELAMENDVTVYAIHEEGFEKTQEFDGFKVVRVGPTTSYSQAGSLAKRASFVKNLISEVDGKAYDIVDGTAILGYIPSWHTGCSHKVITYHDVWTGRWTKNVGFFGLAGEVLERYVLSRDWDSIIAVSNYTKENLIKAGVEADVIDVCENGVDVKELEAVECLKYEHPTVTCVARLVGYKRVGDLIRAAALVKEHIPDLRVKIIGTGPQEMQLKALTRKTQLTDNVEFTGYLRHHANVLKAIKSSHAFCLPSVVEGFGISVVEAMALNVPYVASDITPIREATRGGVGGLLFKPEDVNELSKSLLRCLMGEVKPGCESIGDYDWKIKAQKVLKAYGRALG